MYPSVYINKQIETSFENIIKKECITQQDIEMLEKLKLSTCNNDTKQFIDYNIIALTIMMISQKEVKKETYSNSKMIFAEEVKEAEAVELKAKVVKLKVKKYIKIKKWYKPSTWFC